MRTMIMAIWREWGSASYLLKRGGTEEAEGFYWDDSVNCFWVSGFGLVLDQTII